MFEWIGVYVLLGVIILILGRIIELLSPKKVDKEIIKETVPFILRGENGLIDINLEYLDDADKQKAIDTLLTDKVITLNDSCDNGELRHLMHHHITKLERLCYMVVRDRFSNDKYIYFVDDEENALTRYKDLTETNINFRAIFIDSDGKHSDLYVKDASDELKDVLAEIL